MRATAPDATSTTLLTDNLITDILIHFLVLFVCAATDMARSQDSSVLVIGTSPVTTNDGILTRMLCSLLSTLKVLAGASSMVGKSGRELGR